MDSCALYTLQLISTNYRRSPLIQGRLEIPAKVIVTMLGTVGNHLLVEKYKKSINDRYVQPKNEIITVFFLFKLKKIKKHQNQKRKKYQRNKVKTSDEL